MSIRFQLQSGDNSALLRYDDSPGTAHGEYVVSDHPEEQPVLRYVYVPYIRRTGHESFSLGDRVPPAYDSRPLTDAQDPLLYGTLQLTLTAMSPLLIGRTSTVAGAQANAPRTIEGNERPPWGTFKGAIRQYYAAVTNSRFGNIPSGGVHAKHMTESGLGPPQTVAQFSPADRLFGPSLDMEKQESNKFDDKMRRGLVTGFVEAYPPAATGTLPGLPNQMSPRLLQSGPKTAFGSDEGGVLRATPERTANRILGRRFLLGVNDIADENPKNTTWKGYFKKESLFRIRVDFRGVDPVELGALCFILDNTRLRFGAYKAFGYGVMSSKVEITTLGPSQANGTPSKETCRNAFLKEVRDAYNTGTSYPLFVRYIAALTGAHLEPT